MSEDAIVATKEGIRFRLESIDCPTCGPAQRRRVGLRGGEHHRYGLGVTTTVVECVTCRLLYPDPFPFPLNAQELYGDPDKYFGDYDPDSRIESSRGITREAVRRAGKTSASLLDVGSGRGQILRAAQLEGMTDVVGLELSDSMAKEAQRRYGVEVERLTIEAYAQRTNRTFDVVVLNAVLEHVYNPDTFMAAVRKLTRPSAVVYIDIPREPSLLTMFANGVSKLLRRETVYNLSPSWPPYHVFGFNPTSLERLLTKHDFRIDELEVWAAPRVPFRADDRMDRARAFVLTQINRVANHTRLAGNMFAWCTRI